MTILKLDAKPGEDNGEYYGTLTVSNLRSEDETPATATQYLALSFKSPVEIGDWNIEYHFETWVEVEKEVSSRPTSDGAFLVKAKLKLKAPHTFDAQKDTVTVGVNGDVRGETGEAFCKTFVAACDEDPEATGTVRVTCAACPDEALTDVLPSIRFSGNEATLHYGEQQDVALEADTYSVIAPPLSTPDGTTRVPVLLSAEEVVVETGKTIPLEVTFGTVTKHAVLNVTIDHLDQLTNETLLVDIVDRESGAPLADFPTPIDHTTTVDLPPSGNAELRVRQIRLNNVVYDFKPISITLSPAVIPVMIDSSVIVEQSVDTTGFVTLPADIISDASLPRQFLVRLSSDDMNYSQGFEIKPGQSAFDPLIKPGDYTVKGEDFIDDATVYLVAASPALHVPAESPLPVEFEVTRSASLKVRGFPDHLSFGGCANLSESNLKDFIAARTPIIFKYAGDDGAGDDQQFIDQDFATENTIKLARSIEEGIGGGHRVLPVMISYTCNLSLGETHAILADADRHMHSYGNYVLALSLAKQNVDADHPVGAAFIVNPDFLGECQKEQFAPSYSMPVREPLQKALDHCVASGLIDPLVIPDSIEDNLRGYVRSVNWLTAAVAGSAVSFGWQSNLWGVGDSFWVYDSGIDVADVARKTADYALECGAFDSEWPADFHAIDRYERDDLTQDAYSGNYCYGPSEWRRYFAFCSAVSRVLKQPVMPWQIPASHLPLTSDAVIQPFDPQHWGTGGSYLLGHPEIAGDMHQIHKTVLDFEFPHPVRQYVFVRDLFENPFDLTRPDYGTFPLRGLFSVLLGGGSTTGIVSIIGDSSPWVRDKLAAYAENPVKFE